MPAFLIPIGGIVRVVTYCKIPGQVSTNTHKWQLTTLTSGASFPSSPFITAMDAQLAGDYNPLLSNDAEYYGSQVYLLNPIGPPPRPDHVNVNNNPGTGGAGLLPSQSSGLISLYSTTLGKIGQGRTYIPFPAVGGNSADGTPTPTYVSDLNVLAATLKTNFAVVDGGITATFRPCLYRGGTDVPRFIESSNAQDAWATQRRRGAYGRLNKVPF